MPATIHPQALTAWTDRLTRESADLDLGDCEDRATFRYRVSVATEPVKSYLVANLATTLGYEGPTLNTRDKAVRALADIWIDRTRTRTRTNTHTTAEA